MAIIHGRNVKIYNSSGTALIGAAKSCIVNMDADNFEVASETSATDKEYIPGRSSWTVELSHLLTTNKGGIPLVKSKYVISYMVGSTQVYTGTVLCLHADIQGAVGNLATGNISMLGSGPLTAV